MAKLGNKNKVYITSSAVSTISGVTSEDVLIGETTDSLNINGNLIEVSDKSTAWQQYIAGVKGASVSVTVNVEDGDTKQAALLTALTGGTAVHVFVGDIDSTEKSGYAFDAFVASIAMSNDNAAVATWQIELTATGAVTKI